ncbi:MAG TPA: BrnT family toxin [Thermodesulfobacteriota bacterium]|nr:BrnT family toxin [Thermodesulfobacteriota bacterium]
MSIRRASFEWDEEKDRENQAKHQVSFTEAQLAFLDPKRVIAEDMAHSSEEERYYCIGRVQDGIMTVRFTYRGNVIRIYGAGYWRKGKTLYEEQNKI